MRSARKALWLLRNGHHLYGTLSNRCSAGVNSDACYSGASSAPSANSLRGNVASLGDPAARQREALTDHEAALVTREEHGEHRVFAGGAKALSRHLAP